MKKYVFIAVLLGLFTLCQSCEKDEVREENPEGWETSLRIKNATGQNFRELLPPRIISEPNYGNIQDFYYTINVGHFGFNVDTLANSTFTDYRTSFTETSATQLITRCRFSYRVYQTSSAYYTKSIDVKDTINLPVLIDCKLGKKYTLTLNDLDGNILFEESE